jgi:hypothetical protein
MAGKLYLLAAPQAMLQTQRILPVLPTGPPFC